MNMIEAMEETVQLAAHKMDSTGEIGDGVSFWHLSSMLDRVQSGDFSDAKIGRWLGYMQGVLVATGAATLDDVKSINKSHAA